MNIRKNVPGTRIGSRITSRVESREMETAGRMSVAAARHTVVEDADDWSFIFFFFFCQS